MNQESSQQFRKVLTRYIYFRGIDIVLHLKDGTIIELDKNRRIEGNFVIRNHKKGKIEKIEISQIKKADFFAA